VTARHDTRAPGVGLSALLHDAIDYAGLFPPAQLDMPGAVAEYASYLRSSDAWALGRFVVPAARLDELAAVAADRPADAGESLGDPASGRGLSAVLGADIAGDADRVGAFNAAHSADADRWWGRVEAVELRAATAEAIHAALRVLPTHLERFVEIPIAGDTTPLARAIRDGGAMAKVRTGGTTADAFPASADLARVLATCVAEGVPFKATAGLHHPLRGAYPLTYEPGSATGSMYGFLNVLLAATLLRSGESEALAREMLEEREPSSVTFDAAGVRWRGHHISAAELAAARGAGMQSFGSCSFREPMDDLTALGLL
jgi:hypothetical protein